MKKELSPRLLKRIEQANAVPLHQVLADYGYPIRGGDREQQFSCDLHGDGRDSKPSARFYPDTNLFYCFACGKTRGPLALTQEKEGLGFIESLRLVEKRYNLSSLPEEDDWTPTVAPEVDVAKKQFEVEQKRLETFLNGLTENQELPPPNLVRLWEIFDKVSFMVHKKHWSQDQGAEALSKVRVALLEKLSHANPSH